MSRWVSIFVLCWPVLGCGVSAEVSRQLGARCDNHDECDELCLTSARFPDGMCTLSCDSNGGCPAASACVDLLEGICLYTCDVTADCGFLGADWRCIEEGGRPDGLVKVCIGNP